MKKRVLSLLLAFCLVLGALPLSALATEPQDAPQAPVTDTVDTPPVTPEGEEKDQTPPAKDETPAGETPDEEDLSNEGNSDDGEKPSEEEAQNNPKEEISLLSMAGEDDPQAEEETACLTVAADAPTAGSTKTGSLYQLKLAEVFQDSEGHSLTYSFESDVSNDKTKIKDGVFYFTAADVGSYEVTLTATCESGSASHTLTITVEAADEGIAAQYSYEETDKSSVTVYVTLSNDGMPVQGADGTILSHLKVTVPYFDLGSYGLEEYYRLSTDDGKGPYTGEDVILRPTGLHLYIYLLERYYMGLSEDKCGKGTSGVLNYSSDTNVLYMDSNRAYESDGKSALTLTGGATSLYMTNFWGHDENLMYFRNHCYPYMSAGWGATSDYILLSDGDTWDVAMFSNWNFYHTGYFAKFDKDAYTVEAGKDLTVSTQKWGTTSESTSFSDVSGLNVALYNSAWELVDGVEYTSGNSLTFTAPEEAGDYYLLAMDSSACTSNAKAAPATARVTVTAKTAAPAEPEQSDYELRVLTFEDADYKGSGNMLGNKDWSSLIDSPQYGGNLLYSSTVYNWYDQGNTELKHEIAENWGSHQYAGGGEAISNYNSGETATYGNYEYQLTVYKKGITGVATSGGGYGGSNNFAVHYGYADDSGYNSSNLQCLTFGDKVARVIDHMYVNSTCYALNCFLNGNGLTESIGESDWVKLVATGHHEDGTTATAEFYLCNGPDNIVTDWTKWDLSGLGKITKLELNMMGSNDNGYGFSQPAYFAYDNVAVRFEESTEEPASEVAFSIDLSACGDAVTGTYLAMDAEDEEKYEEKTLTSGSKNEFSSETGAYGFYCVELKTAKSSNITGWKVNGTEYALSSVSTDYPLDNDVCITIGPGESDDILQFDLTLGADNMAYATESTWEIVPVLHTCVFDKQVATEDYLASAATCQAAATYYLSCQCGKHGTKVFSSGDLAAHKDEDGDMLCDVCKEKMNSKPTLIEGVTNVTAKVQTGHGYQLKDLENGKIFEDADGDTLNYSSYFYVKSSDGGETWSEEQHFTASLYGGNDMTFVNDKEGTYIYKFRAYDGKEYSDDVWTLTLIVMDVVPADINFYVGKDQNYSSNGGVYPVLELYRTAGIDDDFNDYIGWFTDAGGNQVKVYNPHLYTIVTEDGKSYVKQGEDKLELHDYEKLTFTNSSFYDADETATPSNTVVGTGTSAYNMFYVSLETGRYSTRFYGTTEDGKECYLGGQSMALPMETDIYGGGGNDLYFRVVSVFTTTKNLDDNYFTAEDYDVKITMPVTGSNIHHGDSYVLNSKTYFPFMSWANGNGSLYNIYAYPEDTENYIFSQTINQTTSAGVAVVTKSVTVNTALTLTVTVPETGDFGLYFQYNNFNTKEVDPLGEASSNNDGTKTLSYRVSKSNSNYTWRLEDPSGTYVTKAGWLKSITTATEMTFTFSEKTDSKSHDFSGLGTTVATRDEADIQLFASHSGFLSTSGTKRIRAYRMWELINSDTANIMVEPDFHFQFLQGSESDLKQVDGGNGGGNWLDVTPTGTDIIAVTYDAIDMYSNANNAGTHGGFFPATNPERTAVMVVTNGASGGADANIAFNGSKETNRGDEWDYNYDTWFYMDTDEAPTLDFTVSGNGVSSVSYAYVTTNSSLVSTLHGWTTVTADEDGYYHADLLGFRTAGTKGGTVIIKMTDATGTSYRLARVAQMSVEVTNASYPNEPFAPGDQVTVIFDGLYRGVDKISGIFNPTSLYTHYTAGDTEAKAELKQYQQMDRVSITLTIPKDLEVGEEGGTYTFTNGYVSGGMYAASSPFGTMYGMSDTGVGTNFSAVSINFVASRLADVTIPVSQKVTFQVKLATATADGTAVEDCTVTVTDAEGTSYTPAEGLYSLGYGDYTYRIEKEGYASLSGSFRLRSEDLEKLTDGVLSIPVTMEALDDNAWTGAGTSEPSQVDGVYQIGTGAELAWFAQAVNGGQTDISAVLTADIQLSGRSWTPIGDSSHKYTGTFDGQGHVVKNLYINATTNYQALFGYLGAATVKNLGVTGSVTTTGTGAAGIAGFLSNDGLITDCFSTVAVTGNKCVGGIAGQCQSYKANIANCYNTGNITVTNSVGGGIAGGSPTGTSMGATITNCYNVGTVRGTSKIGAVSANTSSSAYVNCYYLDGCCVGSTNAGKGTAKTAAELKALAETLGDAFAPDTERINGGYPVLAWQVPAKEDLNGDGNVNMLDVVRLLEAINDSSIALEGGDLNGDGNRNMLDVVYLLELINGTTEG